MQWQLEGDRPIYQQLVDQIMMQIVSGQRKAGDKVPAVRELAAEAGVNPNTMQRALADLERQGLLYTNRTSGRYVTEDEEMITKIRERIAEERICAFLVPEPAGGLPGLHPPRNHRPLPRHAQPLCQF